MSGVTFPGSLQRGAVDCSFRNGGPWAGPGAVSGAWVGWSADIFYMLRMCNRGARWASLTHGVTRNSSWLDTRYHPAQEAVLWVENRILWTAWMSFRRGQAESQLRPMPSKVISGKVLDNNDYYIPAVYWWLSRCHAYSLHFPLQPARGLSITWGRLASSTQLFSKEFRS